MTGIRNLTPHPVHLVLDDDTLVVPPERPPLPRVAETVVHRATLTVDGGAVPLVTLRVGAVEHLPDPEPGVLLVVPRVVAAARPDRTDLVVPWSPVRDAAGVVVGCLGLARLTRPGG